MVFPRSDILSLRMVGQVCSVQRSSFCPMIEGKYTFRHWGAVLLCGAILAFSMFSEVVDAAEKRYYFRIRHDALGDALDAFAREAGHPDAPKRYGENGGPLT